MPEAAAKLDRLGKERSARLGGGGRIEPARNPGRG